MVILLTFWRVKFPFVCTLTNRLRLRLEQLLRIFRVLQTSRVLHISMNARWRIACSSTVEPRFNEVAGDRPNLFVKWRVRYIENLDVTNLRGNDQNVRYIEVIVND